MFKLLVDTSVWLDMAKEPQQELLLSVLEELIKLQEVGILLPRVVIDEFQRNRQRVVDDSRRSLSGVIKRVKEAVDKYGGSASKKKVLEQLNDIDHRLPMLGDEVGNSLARIEKLLGVTGRPLTPRLATASHRATPDEDRAAPSRDRFDTSGNPASPH
jgi:hypothetical protein